MEESTLRWPTDKERVEKEEVCSIGEVPHTEKSYNNVILWFDDPIIIPDYDTIPYRSRKLLNICLVQLPKEFHLNSSTVFDVCR